MTKNNGKRKQQKSPPVTPKRDPQQTKPTPEVAADKGFFEGVIKSFIGDQTVLSWIKTFDAQPFESTDLYGEDPSCFHELARGVKNIVYPGAPNSNLTVEDWKKFTKACVYPLETSTLKIPPMSRKRWHKLICRLVLSDPMKMFPASQTGVWKEGDLLLMDATGAWRGAYEILGAVWKDRDTFVSFPEEPWTPPRNSSVAKAPSPTVIPQSDHKEGEVTTEPEWPVGTPISDRKTPALVDSVEKSNTLGSLGNEHSSVSTKTTHEEESTRSARSFTP